MSYLKNPGLTKGIVVDTEDPAGFNRVKVRIVELHGAVSEDVYQYCRDYNNLRVTDDSLPWCEVCYAYGSTVKPEVNDVVLIGYISGSTDQPVILGWLGYQYTDREDILYTKVARSI